MRPRGPLCAGWYMPAEIRQRFACLKGNSVRVINR